MICNNKGPDQPAHPRSIISNFVVSFLRRIIPRLALCKKNVNYLSSLFSWDSLCRKPRRQVFSRRGLCCLLDSSRTNTSSATDNNIKNIYNEEDILTGIAVFDCTLHRLRNYCPQSRGTAGGFDFLATGLWYDHKCGSRERTGGPDPPPPPGTSQVIWVSIGNKQLDPPPPPPPPGKSWTPLENVGPPLEPWKMIGFFEINNLNSVK